jgi:hypothetical protein
MAQNIFCSGRWGSIVIAERRDGSSPASDFLDGLSVRDQAKMIALLQRAADMGWMNINNAEKFKKIADGWFEFKCHQIRMPCYSNGRDLILTHGFIKKKDDFPPSEIRHAELIKAEHDAKNSANKPDPNRNKKK